MKEHFKKIYGVRFIQSTSSLTTQVVLNGKAIVLDDIDLIYRDIIHPQEDGLYLRYCEECGIEHQEIHYKTIIDLKVEDFTEEDRAKQRKPIDDLIQQLL